LRKVGDDRHEVRRPRAYKSRKPFGTLPPNARHRHLVGPRMRILHILGVLFIVAWLLLWLGLKIAFAAVHLLVVVGVLLIIGGLIAGRSAGAKS
jgi:hypothetical protein